MSLSENSSKSNPIADPPMENLVIGDVSYRTRLTSKFKNRVRWTRPDEKNVTAVIPGSIKKILEVEGARVEQGTPLLILEAMKMENLVLSPSDGVIKKISVTEGEQVSKSQHLVELI